MHNPVFVAMEMPRFEMVIENISSAVEQSDPTADAAFEAQIYASEPVASDYLATEVQALRRPAWASHKGAVSGAALGGR